MDSALAQWEEKETSAAGRIQYSQDISWQARKKTQGLVRPPTTRSYILLWAEETKPTRECCKPGALDPPLQHTKMPADCYKNAPVNWCQTGGKGRQWSCRELLTETTWRASTVDWRKCGGPIRKDPFTWNQQMEWRPSLTARELWEDIPGDIYHEALDNIPLRITKTSLDEIPTMAEMARAIAGLKDGKAPGGDGIHAEVWKHGGDNLLSRLHQLIINAWEVGSVPQTWKDASTVTIYKKGDWTDCGNYRGISLLSVAGRIFARILLNRLSTHITPEVVPETQCGFRGNRSTVDMIFCLRQLQEKCIEQHRPLYMVFVDLSKAFDTVGRTGLWQLLRKYWCPGKFTTMVEALRTGIMANVGVGGEVSESFSVTNGVKLGYVLALLHLRISNARRDFPRHGGWRLHTVQTERWPIQRRTLQSEDQDYTDTDERAAIRRWQWTCCPLCWRDSENSGCFLRCVKEVQPED